MRSSNHFFIETAFLLIYFSFFLSLLSLLLPAYLKQLSLFQQMAKLNS